MLQKSWPLSKVETAKGVFMPEYGDFGMFFFRCGFGLRRWCFLVRVSDFWCKPNTPDLSRMRNRKFSLCIMIYFFFFGNTGGSYCRWRYCFSVFLWITAPMPRRYLAISRLVPLVFVGSIFETDRLDGSWTFFWFLYPENHRDNHTRE